jgi:DNA-binding NarL/FixJ family response regulator
MIFLPLWEIQRYQDSVNRTAMEKSHSRQTITVAIVEDDCRIRASLQEILDDDEGLECVAVCGSAEEAIESLPALAPQVVLMDVNLPGMNGVECVRRLTALLAKCQIIMLTVREDSDIIFKSLAAGASGYLLKPPRTDDLVSAVHDVFAGGAPMTASIARRVVQSFNQAAPSAREGEELTRREQEVLDRLVKGFTYKETAADLGISYSTVQSHIEKIYKKLHVHSCAQAVAKYLTN